MNLNLAKTAIVSDLTSELQQRSDILQMSDEELRDAIGVVVLQHQIRARGNHQLRTQYLKYTYQDWSAIETDIFNSIRGLSVIDRILLDQSISEIMINGYDQIFIEQEGVVRQIPEQFANPDQLLSIITKLVSAADRTVSFSNPIVDARLADGSRVNVVLAPIALNGPIVTIRRFPKRAMTMNQLVQKGTLSKTAAAFLHLATTAKYNLFICGGTGSGKTTLLNALVNSIASDVRVVTIEDSAELQLTNIQNLVQLEARHHHYDETKTITIRDLIRTALRMRPERIIVGEVRGSEALDMLQAMNTGHDGSISTGHANSPVDMFSRLETMVLSGAAGLPLVAVQRQIAAAIDIMVFLSRGSDFKRRVTEISEVVDYRDGVILLNPLFTRSDREDGDLVRSQNYLQRKGKLQKYSTLCKEKGFAQEVMSWLGGDQNL